MDAMKIAFVGVGSIATRHIVNVKDYLETLDIPFQIDVFRSGFDHKLSNDILRIINRQFLISDELHEKYDVVFVTNPTSLHFDTLKRFQFFGKFFFIEKPVFSSFDEDLSSLQNLIPKNCYVACPLRYNPVIDYIKNNIDCSKVFSVRAISSSYLPEWRPGTDYRNCYSAHASQGGGVDIDLIHEWDYITYLFGDMNSGFCISDKISKLEIDSNDAAIYIARNNQTTVELHLDYYGRVSIRKIMMFTDDETIDCDILQGTICFLKSGKKISVTSERNEYQLKEIEHFFNIVLGETKSDSTVEHAVKVLRYAKGVF